jgi:hypothetical protein
MQRLAREAKYLCGGFRERHVRFPFACVLAFFAMRVRLSQAFCIDPASGRCFRNSGAPPLPRPDGGGSRRCVSSQRS